MKYFLIVAAVAVIGFLVYRHFQKMKKDCTCK